MFPEPWLYSKLFFWSKVEHNVVYLDILQSAKYYAGERIQSKLGMGRDKS